MIENIKSFVLTYWREIAVVIFYLSFLIVSLITRKGKTVESVKEVILEVLPKFITMVEHPGDGAAKLQEVVSCVLVYLRKLYPGLDFSGYTTFIKENVEKILKCPQKKGASKYE